MLTEATDDSRNVDPRSADELGQYRSMSTLAVAAFLLGLGSVLTFVTPMLVAIPLTAIAIAGLALAKIHSSGGSLTGSWLARAGLVLAIIFAVAAYAHVYVRDSLSIRHADVAAQKWLASVSAGRMEEALETMTPSALMKLRPPAGGRNVPPPPFDRDVAVEILRQDPLIHVVEPASASKGVVFRLLQGRFFGRPHRRRSQHGNRSRGRKSHRLLCPCRTTADAD